MARLRRRLPCVLTPVLALALACGGDDGGSTPDGDRPENPDTENPDETPAAAASYINTLEIPEDPCCFDFGDISKDNIENGTDEMDNALGTIAATLGNFFDIQQVLDDSITDGSLILLLKHTPTGGDALDLSILLGEFAEGTDPLDGQDGVAKFTVGPQAAASVPAVLANGQLSAGPLNLPLSFPFGPVAVDVEVNEVQLTGSATISGDSISYDSGTLGGYIALDDLYSALNEFARTCTCLDKSDDLFVKTDGEWEGDCVSDAAALCPDDSACATVAGDSLLDGEICGFAPLYINSSADINLEGDATHYEGLSVGFRWTATTATIVEP